MKKFTKKILFIFLGFIIFTQILDLVGWLTDEKLAKKTAFNNIISKIKPSENGYEFVKFMDEPGFRFHEKCCDDEKALQSLPTNEAWNNNQAIEILGKYKKYQDVIQQVNSRKHFKSKTLKSFLDPLPAYGGFGNLLQLKLIESRLYAEKQNIAKSIKLAEQALTFTQRIKSDQNPTLISFLVGLNYQTQALLWIHSLGTRYELTPEERQKLIKVSQLVSDYQNDNFDAVIIGEINFSDLILQDTNLASLEGRKAILMSVFKPEEETLLEVIGNFFIFLSPHYVMQKNKVSNETYEHRAKDLAFVRNSCNKVDYSHYPEDTNQERNSRFSLLKLNSVGASWIEAIYSFEEYFFRRCQADFYAKAVKTALAITQFESINNRQIKNLTELVPNTIHSTPIDATNGKPILFNQTQRWLYSVGSNFSDDGGSNSSFYNRKCPTTDSCKNNPTVPIIHQAIAIENEQ